MGICRGNRVRVEFPGKILYMRACSGLCERVPLNESDIGDWPARCVLCSWDGRGQAGGGRGAASCERTLYRQAVRLFWAVCDGRAGTVTAQVTPPPESSLDILWPFAISSLDTSPSFPLFTPLPDGCLSRLS